MEILQRILQMKEVSREAKSEGKKIGFVPTMGFLHEGHLALVREARRLCDVVVVSIFVNPTQFAPGEDFEAYPRDVTRDVEMLTNEDVDYIFIPKNEEMYPENFHTFVKVKDLSEKLCGKTRPTHFEGVTTVVTKLLNIVDPEYAFFGQKDAQQFVIIQRMVRDLNMNLDVVRVPIVRELDGLAMSSRNTYLSPEERQAATVLHRALEHVRKRYEEGEKKAKTLIAEMREIIEAEPLAKIDYVDIVDLSELKEVKTVKPRTLIAVAVYIGKTRLIDNVIIEK